MNHLSQPEQNCVTSLCVKEIAVCLSCTLFENSGFHLVPA